MTAGPELPIRLGEQREPARQPLESVLLTAGVVDAIRSLVEIMDRGGLTELDLSHGDLAVRLRSGGGGGGHAPVPSAGVASPLDSPFAEAPLPIPTIPHPAPETAPAAEPGDYVVTSPMVGTYYSAPTPGAPVFVEIGDRVEAGQTVGIVEAMKIMNEIAAERGGYVVAILVENGQPVEYGSPLLRLDTLAGRGGLVGGGAPAGIGGLG